MRKLILCMLAVILLSACDNLTPTPDVGIVTNIESNPKRTGFWGDSRYKYCVKFRTLRVNKLNSGYDVDCILYTNTLHQIGDTIRFK